MNKIIVLLIISSCCNPLISMEQLSITSEMRVPLEIKKHISAQLPQWWYLQHTFGCSDAVSRVAIDSHKKLLATSARRNVYIFDMKTKRCVTNFFHKYFVSEICLSSCGSLLATACYDDGTISLFDIQTQTKITSLQRYNYESIGFNSQENLQVDRYDETYIFNKKDNSWSTVPKKRSNHSHHFNRVQLDYNTVHLFNDKKEKIASFSHDKQIFAACADRPANILITGCLDYKARIFALYKNDTLDQRMLKTALNKWILIEKPSQELTTHDMILSDVATKCFDPSLHISKDTLTTICQTFPKDMQDALWRTTHYKIQKYGKSTSSYCSIQ